MSKKKEDILSYEDILYKLLEPNKQLPDEMNGTSGVSLFLAKLVATNCGVINTLAEVLNFLTFDEDFDRETFQYVVPPEDIKEAIQIVATYTMLQVHKSCKSIDRIVYDYNKAKADDKKNE